jgi:hypothetical protein
VNTGLVKPTRHSDFLLIFEALKSVIADRSALYVSAPITSGRRFHDWILRSNGSLPNPAGPEYVEEHQRWVIEPNREHAFLVITALRQKHQSRVIIDPTAMGDLPDWNQNDYRYFWGEVIRQFVSQLVFVNDWQFSSGCAYEFLVATQEGLPTLDESGTRITLRRGLQLLMEVRSSIHTHSESARFFDKIVRELSQLQSPDKDKIYA